MEVFKFETKILENGIIKIPQISQYKNQDIEIFIVFKSLQENKKQQSIDDFLDKWTGFAKDIDADKEKFNYLTKKHQ